jgi:thioesterase domain-containing protein
LQTVEELAEHCHREWLAKNGDRPVIVGGHSFGALVAYHVAILRIREGLPTPRVVIIDARHPDALSARQPIVGPRSAKRRYHALRQKIEARQAIEQALARLNLGEVVPTELRRDYILGTYLLATLKYQPPVFRGHLEVLRSREFAERSPVDLWEKSAICSVRRVVLDGTHMSLVREPEGIASIANHLRRICGEVKSERAHAKLEASQRLAGSS